MIRRLGACVLACGFGLTLLAGTAPAAQAGWKLTFSDEFDGDKVDATKWKRSDLWANQTLAGNNEKQCYVPEAVSQEGGKLILTARSAKTPQAACKGANFDLSYTSGMVTTSGCNQWERRTACAALKRFSQAYGYFEMRAKLPKGKGFWPAFWLVPADATWPPEIDIMEFLGHESDTIYTTYHYNDAAGAHQKDGHAFKAATDFSKDFHTFAVDWKPGLIVWYVDGVEAFRTSGEKVTSKPMYILMNLAVGGNWPGDPNFFTRFPAAMEIDYVRVYERVNDGLPDERPPSEPYH